MHIFIKDKYLIYKDNKVKCAIGKKGVGFKKKEGDLITPKGVYKIKNIFYRKDRVKNLKTKIKTIVINKKMGWCDDIRSAKYNKLIKYPFNFSFEKLYRTDNIYDVIIVLNYNMNPIKKNKGSAIFVHIAKKNFLPTKGCVAIKKNEIKKLIRFISKKTIVKIS
tara:strand:- start:175 stop:666 length:492 start_codon:yes stop_codon:yes gene_type:complete